MVNIHTLQKAYRLMCTAGAMATVYEQNRSLCRYVHSTSRGHEAIQLAAAFHLQPIDFVSPYYRDESMLLGLGFSPYDLMLQLLAKGDDPFTGGREYYSHPNYRGQGKPTIIHQSSATGMQAIPATGIAQGVAYREKLEQLEGRVSGERPVVLCSLGDASVTEGEVSEAFQFAALHQLPVIYLVQDNDWGISVTAAEARTVNAYEFMKGFKGIERITIDGSSFEDAFLTMEWVVEMVRQHRQPCLLHAKVPLLGHHTSGVRKEFYRTPQDLEKDLQRDPCVKLRQLLLSHGVSADELDTVAAEARRQVQADFDRAAAAPEPHPDSVESFVFVPTPINEEKGERSPAGKEKIIMVDAALSPSGKSWSNILRQFYTDKMWDAGWAGFSAKQPRWPNASATIGYSIPPYRKPISSVPPQVCVRQDSSRLWKSSSAIMCIPDLTSSSLKYPKAVT